MLSHLITYPIDAIKQKEEKREQDERYEVYNMNGRHDRKKPYLLSMMYFPQFFEPPIKVQVIFSRHFCLLLFFVVCWFRGLRLMIGLILDSYSTQKSYKCKFNQRQYDKYERNQQIQSKSIQLRARSCILKKIEGYRLQIFLQSN